MKRNGIAGILAAVLLSAWSLPAGAEETYKLDPVLVTAEKRTENVQDVPVSVTAISEQQIKDSGIRSIQDVAPAGSEPVHRQLGVPGQLVRLHTRHRGRQQRPGHRLYVTT